MGHRHVFGSSEMFHMANNQNHNHIHNQNPIHVQQPCVQLGRTSASSWEDGSVVLPSQNMSARGVNLDPYLNSISRSSEYCPATTIEIPQYGRITSGPFSDPFPPQSAARNLSMIPQRHAGQPSSSSSSYGHNNGVEHCIMDPVTGSQRGSYKRKTPAGPEFCNRQNTSRYYTAGSHSDHSVSPDTEKPIFHPQHRSWGPMDVTPGYRGSNLSIAEGSDRNVRRRYSLEFEANLARTPITDNPSIHFHSAGNLIHHSSRVDNTNQNRSAATPNWNHIPSSLDAQGRFMDSGINGWNGVNQFPVGSNNHNLVEFGALRHNISNRYSVLPQNGHGVAPHVARGHQTSYAQIPVPSYRVVPRHPNSGYMATSSRDGLQLMPEIHSSSNSGAFAATEFRSNDRRGRSRSSYDDSHSYHHEVYTHGRQASEDSMMVDRAILYDSRDLLDQHRDMRLDIDNMSYEELLALGERIGNVNTGLSEDLISKCSTKTAISNTDQTQEGQTCIICLEEYRNGDEVVKLINCGHDYHVECITKWLSMKNACPICKAPVLADKSKEE